MNNKWGVHWVDNGDGSHVLSFNSDDDAADFWKWDNLSEEEIDERMDLMNEILLDKNKG